MHTKEDASDLLRGFNIELKEWSNKLHGPAIIIRNNKEVKVKWLSKLVYKLRARRNKGVIKCNKLTKEQIQLFLTEFDITLIEYSGKLKAPAKIKLSNGNIKSITRLDKFIDRLKEKLPGNILLSILGNTSYTKINLNTYYCNKHQSSFIVNENSNNIRCPECVKEQYIEIAREYCINAEITGFIYGGNTCKNKIESKCLLCNHVFSKTWDEISRTKKIRCPLCRYHQECVKKHKFFYNYAQYEDYTRKLTKLNRNTYVDIIENKENMHLDHKFSIYYAYKNHIPPWMCAAPSNLEYLPAHDNLLKQRYSSVSLSDFLVSFSDFIKVHPEYLEMVKSIEDTEEVPGGTKEVLEVTNSD